MNVSNYLAARTDSTFFLLSEEFDSELEMNIIDLLDDFNKHYRDRKSDLLDVLKEEIKNQYDDLKIYDTYDELVQNLPYLE